MTTATSLRPWSDVKADMAARIDALIDPRDVARFGEYHARQVARGRLERQVRSRWERSLRGLRPAV
jgi:hypothetical protein